MHWSPHELHFGPNPSSLATFHESLYPTAHCPRWWCCHGRWCSIPTVGANPLSGAPGHCCGAGLRWMFPPVVLSLKLKHILDSFAIMHPEASFSFRPFLFRLSCMPLCFLIDSSLLDHPSDKWTDRTIHNFIFIFLNDPHFNRAWRSRSELTALLNTLKTEPTGGLEPHAVFCSG
jgi:hypothetical protein